VDAFRRQPGTRSTALLDVTMPRLGGAEALQEIRRLNPAVPAIITSGYSRQDVAARFAATPFEAFLQKPFNSHALRQAVQLALGRGLT
jgi:CheY-like chemotaxis protein